MNMVANDHPVAFLETGEEFYAAVDADMIAELHQPRELDLNIIIKEGMPSHSLQEQAKAEVPQRWGHEVEEGLDQVHKVHIRLVERAHPHLVSEEEFLKALHL
jgi:hypothetical protein